MVVEEVVEEDGVEDTKETPIMAFVTDSGLTGKSYQRLIMGLEFPVCCINHWRTKGHHIFGDGSSRGQGGL